MADDPDSSEDVLQHQLSDQTVVEDEETEHVVKVEPEIEKPYSIFTPAEKWFIVGMASIAGIFSPLSANIYFPVIPVLATAFNRPVELINVTITVNMIFQGISPMIWGSLADSRRCGRRPVYLSCLLLLSLSCIGLALTPTDAYWLLVLLRCVQAAGSASVIALGAGTIVDIATSAERGGFLGVFNLAPMVGPCLGPVAGGLLADNLGWRAVFWFLCIAAGVTFIFEFLFMPETLRTIVGDGSVKPPLHNTPIIPILGRGRKVNPDDPVAVPEIPRGGNTPWDALKLFRNIDVVLVLFSNAIPYCLFYGITTTLSPIFLDNYPWLTENAIGLCFLANGTGCGVGSLSSGKLLDWDWRRAKRRLERKAELEKSTKAVVVHTEHARLRSSPYYWGFFLAGTLAYGWCAWAKVHIAVLLVLQFITGWMVTGIFTLNQTLLMDLFPGRGASITACNNLVRCLSGAVLVSIITYIRDAVGPGWTFTILAGVTLLSYPMVLVEWRMGRKWRQQREEMLATGA